MGALAGPALNLLRMLFIAAMQTAAFVAVSNVIESFVDFIRDTLKKEGGLNESETDDAMLNTTIDALAVAGVTLAALKTRIPVRLADKLGLKVGKTQKVALTSKGQAAVAKVSATGGLSGLLPKSFLGKIALSFGASLPWLPGLIQQFGDQAAFAPKAANDYYDSLFGVRPFTEANALDSPGPFTGAEFKDYARGLETAGIVGLEYPLGSFLYSQEQLAKLVDYVAGIENGKGKTTTAKSIVALVAPYLIMKDQTKPVATTPTKTTTSTSTLSVPKVQVFTGVLAQGVLGKGLEFQARPDDLIENAQEMLDAGANNLAPFIAALPSRITYQVRVVNSVKTKDGFEQKGSVAQLLNGYNKDGSPKYKTVVNKFAVLDIYILNDKKSRIKLETITLGPVDSIKFQVSQGTLSTIDAGLSKVAVTSDIKDVKGISTVNPVTVTTPVTPAGNTEQYKFYIGRFGSPEKLLPSAIAGVPGFTEITEAEYNRLKNTSVTVNNAGVTTTTTAPTTTPTPSAPAPATPPPVTVTIKPGANASNLSEWYTANGQSLPSLSARAQLYQQYGLGQSAYYTGTAEQNTNLLNRLKSL